MNGHHGGKIRAVRAQRMPRRAGDTQRACLHTAPTNTSGRLLRELLHYQVVVSRTENANAKHLQ
jgi:hypothetical protein